MISKAMFLFVLVALCSGFRRLSKEEQVDEMNKMSKLAEPFQRNITECSRQVKASHDEVDRFLRRIPQETMPGKCLVACVFRRNQLLIGNTIQTDLLIESNIAAYGKNSEIVSSIEKALETCQKKVEGIFEICEMTSSFNDCMHELMDAVLTKITMEQRMDALEEMEEEDSEDDWEANEEEDVELEEEVVVDEDQLQQLKDEL